MRKGWRDGLAILVMSFMGASSLAARGESGRTGTPASERVALAVELSWSVAAEEAAPASATSRELTIELTDGDVIEAVAWPPTDPSDRRVIEPADAGDGPRRLGSEPTGRIRARIESGLAAELVVKRGGQVVRLPLAAILERPQHIAAPAPLSLKVERLPWDALAVDFGAGAESGVSAPGVEVPVTVGYNILHPDAAEVTVRTTAVLRPIGKQEPVWRFEQREIVPANRHEPPSRLWSVPAPEQEGTYVLELQAVWEAVGARDGSRIGRLIRRRKGTAVTGTASRRVVLAVVDPKAKSAPLLVGDPRPRETEVDSLDLSRIRNTRFSAWGRSPVSPGSPWEIPEEVFVEAGRREKERERLRSFITRAGAEPASLGAADATSLSWSAVALHVAHPEKAHRISVTIAGGEPSALGVALVDPGSRDRAPRLLLDACGSGPPVLKPGPTTTFNWIFWPGTTEPVLILLNRDAASDVRIGGVKLVELDPTTAPRPSHPQADPPKRGVGLLLTGPNAIDRFGGSGESGLTNSLETVVNLESYLAACGGTLVVLPEHLGDRPGRRGLSGQLCEDATGPDRLDLALRILQRHEKTAWLELDLEGKHALPGLPPPDSAEALQQGLVRIGRLGVADGASYHPLNPRVRDAMKARVVESLAKRGDGLGFSGVLIRLGRGPTLLGTPDTGMDDDTYARFVNETFGPEVAKEIPGLSTTDPDRFTARSKYLAGVGRMPWLTWRARAIAKLYTELAEAARAASPGAVLALATPTLDSGPAANEAKRVDLAGLAPSQAWRSVGLDLELWPSGPEAPLVLRGAELASDALAHDLAAHPDLDAKVAAFPNCGFLLGVEGEAGTNEAGSPADSQASAPRLALTSLPLGDGAQADEPLAHAIAAFDAHWVVLSAAAVAGHEDRLRRYGDVLAHLPARTQPTPAASQDRKDSGVVVRSLVDGKHTILQFANDTPYPIRMAGLLKSADAANVEDLGRNLRLAPQSVAGGRQLVIDLLPFGVSIIRVDAPHVELAETTPYPSEAVLTSMEAKYQELSNQLARLNRGGSSTLAEPANPGFEQEPAAPASATPATPESPIPGGWRLDKAGEAGAKLTLDKDRPHSGTRSLKLEASRGAAAVVSGEFVPNSGSTMLIQAHLRGDKDNAIVRVWIEGESGGRPYVRRSEIVVPREWKSLAVRASDLPPGGLDSARLKFEVAAAGSLWLDDVKIVGEATPKAVRVNAQRALLAALQAYREQRFADFARLADSHWAKHPSVVALSRSGREQELSDSREKPAAAAPAASALPSNRTLR
ncbi:hypothetical protein [Paludisphaera borealis]|uniref:Uncharacterized protein n=1 Tax=Paludisphaera borealis TaxID=1387353 RepID=A0A1U7CWX9_9BACT|nr:hypothetical protein [Paludisphaera borealis]APW63444.1 hypothetical protein BSF38_05011 [Paludisphaera borealis]